METPIVQNSVDAVDWVERIPFSETRNYVQRVMENLQVYRNRFGETTTTVDPNLHRAAIVEQPTEPVTIVDRPSEPAAVEQRAVPVAAEPNPPKPGLASSPGVPGQLDSSIP